MNHATVRIGEYTIPLIGVPKESTEEKCEVCEKTIHLADMILCDDGKVRCQKCKEQYDQPKPK